MLHWINSLVDYYHKQMNQGLIGKLIFSNLNQSSLRIFICFQIIGSFFTIILALIFYNSLPFYVFFWVMFTWPFITSFLALLSECFRYSVLHKNNAYENTKYILYIIFFWGLFGCVFTSLALVEIISTALSN